MHPQYSAQLSSGFQSCLERTVWNVYRARWFECYLYLAKLVRPSITLGSQYNIKVFHEKGQRERGEKKSCLTFSMPLKGETQLPNPVGLLTHVSVLQYHFYSDVITTKGVVIWFSHRAVLLFPLHIEKLIRLSITYAWWHQRDISTHC